MQNTLILPESPAATISAPRLTTLTPPARTAHPHALAVRRILLPFDLSRPGVCALRAVARFAENAGATLHLLHVVKPAETTGIEPRSDRTDDSMAEASERLLKHWVKRVVQGRVQTFVSIRIGEPVDVIVARAIATRADLIVMTSRSCSGLKNELQRSSAERVSRLAPCPVLTIPEKCADEIAYSFDRFPPESWRTILVPVDFSPSAEKALRFAAAFVRANGAKLLLAHGAETPNANENVTGLRLRSWAEDVLNGPLPCQTAVWPGGHSLYAILSEAVRAEADLIVLPTRLQSWAQRLRAGSITDGVLRQAPCPVLSINETLSLTDD